MIQVLEKDYMKYFNCQMDREKWKKREIREKEEIDRKSEMINI